MSLDGRAISERLTAVEEQMADVVALLTTDPDQNPLGKTLTEPMFALYGVAIALGCWREARQANSARDVGALLVGKIRELKRVHQAEREEARQQ